MKLCVLGYFAVSTLCVSASLHAADCQLLANDQVTDDFYFAASSDQGAVGDVVAVDISLAVEKVHGQFIAITAIGCFDNKKAELVGGPFHSEVFDQLAPSADFYTLPLGQTSEPRGFVLNGAVRRELAATLFPSAQPIHLATVFFRLKGAPGESLPVDLCDFRNRSEDPGCNRSRIQYATQTGRRTLIAFSTRHVPGEVRILPGEPTRPNPPEVPTLAKVYPEAPTAESAAIRFELTGAVVQPGAGDIPVSLYASSNHEWSGFAVSLKYPAALVELASLDEHTRPAAVKIDNAEGGLGMFMTNSRRRIGAEGERVKLATLHFQLKPEAAAGTEVTPSFEPYGPYLNWVQILHLKEAADEVLPVAAEVTPLTVVNGLLKVQSRPTMPGDVNADFALELTDAVLILARLFRGEDRILCPEAMDFNQDHAVNMTDPVAILRHLFLGGPSPSPKDIYCNTGE